jgi:hypothetical protein
VKSSDNVRFHAAVSAALAISLGIKACEGQNKAFNSSALPHPDRTTDARTSGRFRVRARRGND